jgi:8-oxo-dGTP pyrophosphatase MutT (NUDIX family)
MITMAKIWQYIGVLAFWLSWPGLWLYFRLKPTRTRVVIVSREHILIVRGWLSSGEWMLPGGGLHKGEDPILGAIREVSEETGITLKPKQLKFLYDRMASERGLKFRYRAYVAYLPGMPRVRKQRFELTDIQWLPLADIEGFKTLSPETKHILASWRDLN